METHTITPHVLLCYDSTPSSYKALNYLKKVFKEEPLSVTLFKVIDSTRLHPYYSYKLTKRFSQEDEVEKEANRLYSEALQELSGVAKSLEKSIKGKVETKVAFKFGEVAYEILRVMEEELFDGVVIGKRGVSRVASFILGGITHKLIFHTTLPVWLVRGSEWNYNFLVAFDTTEVGLRVIDYVSFILASHSKARVTFFHAYHPFSEFEEFKGSFSELTKRLKSQKLKAFFEKVRKTFHVNGFNAEKAEFLIKRTIFGIAGEIIRVAKKRDYSTVIIGRKNQTSLKQFFLGSVSQKVISYFEDRTIWVIH